MNSLNIEKWSEQIDSVTNEIANDIANALLERTENASLEFPTDFRYVDQFDDTILRVFVERIGRHKCVTIETTEDVYGLQEQPLPIMLNIARYINEKLFENLGD